MQKYMKTILLVALIVGVNQITRAEEEGKVYDGDGGGDIKVSARTIKKVDGKGNWIMTGEGQDLEIIEKNGDGSLTLKNFGKITIKVKKDGNGKLIVEANNGDVFIKEVNGSGQTYLRNPGKKTVNKKDGDGNIYYKGMIPTISEKNGKGTVVQE